jgi:hypothetical protein
MIDSVMALCITLIGIAGLLSIMPIGWGLAGSSDMRTMASEILQQELENMEMLVMNPCNTIVLGAITDKTVYSSGSSNAQAGNRSFVVQRTIGQSTTGWEIQVRVKWSGSTTGIVESRLVMRQPDYSDSLNCASGTRLLSF